MRKIILYLHRKIEKQCTKYTVEYHKTNKINPKLKIWSAVEFFLRQRIKKEKVL